MGNNKKGHQPEAFARVLIDRALSDSEWDLLNPQQVQFEFHIPTGRADYLLKDSLGRVLCVLEAKREDLDPYDSKEQARGYADNLNAPFVILSNGREHWFWNLQRVDHQDAYRIERLPSQEDLERVRLKNLQPPRPLGTEVVTPDYLYRLKPDLKLRGYQIKAMDAIAGLYDQEGRRKFLLEMATGTGARLANVHLVLNPGTPYWFLIDDGEPYEEKLIEECGTLLTTLTSLFVERGRRRET